MTNFRVSSIDGFGERDDIALERERNSPSLWKTQDAERAALHQALLDAGEYGTGESAKNISEIVKSMIERERWQILLSKSEVIWDVDSVWDAVTEACIRLGLGDEEFSPHIVDDGFQIEINLF